MLFVVLGWAVVALWRTGTRGRSAEPPMSKAGEAGGPAGRVWPLDGTDSRTDTGPTLDRNSRATPAEPSADELFPDQAT
jgi:hypothetical protein